MIILYSAGFELQLDLIFGIPTSTTFDVLYIYVTIHTQSTSIDMHCQILIQIIEMHLYLLIFLFSLLILVRFCSIRILLIDTVN